MFNPLMLSGLSGISTDDAVKYMMQQQIIQQATNAQQAWQQPPSAPFQQQQQPPRSMQQARGTIKCYNCGQDGHVSRNCLLPDKRQQQQVDNVASFAPTLSSADALELARFRAKEEEDKRAAMEAAQKAATKEVIVETLRNELGAVRAVSFEAEGEQA